MSRTWLIAAAALGVVHAAPAQFAAPIAESDLCHDRAPRTVVYKTVGDVELLLHVFEPLDHRAGDRRAAIVFFFGGGWFVGEPEQFFPHCAYLASRGMVAMSAEYRLRDVHGATPFDSVADARSAMRWVRGHAAELGVDSGRIAAGGGSAGGHLAAAAAHLRAFDDPTDDVGVSCRPDALVLFNPVIDNGPGEYGHERVEDRWREFSPAHNIRKGAPPTVVFQGTTDRIVGPAVAVRYAERMAEVGSRHELWLYEGKGHGFFRPDQGDGLAFGDAIREMDRFLRSLAFVRGEPTLAGKRDPARRRWVAAEEGR